MPCFAAKIALQIPLPTPSRLQANNVHIIVWGEPDADVGCPTVPIPHSILLDAAIAFLPIASGVLKMPFTLWTCDWIRETT